MLIRKCAYNEAIKNPGEHFIFRFLDFMFTAKLNIKKSRLKLSDLEAPRYQRTLICTCLQQIGN